MFGLGWCMAVEVWIGVGNINFPYENGLLWVQLGSQPTCRVRTPDVHAVQCFPPPSPPCSGISGDPSALFTAYPPRARAMQPAIPSLSTGECAQSPTITL